VHFLVKYFHDYLFYEFHEIQMEMQTKTIQTKIIHMSFLEIDIINSCANIKPKNA